MADRIILPRATDSNGDIVAGAQAYFYESGTTTPATVYSDSAGSIVAAQPLTADAAGNFAATFATQSLKVDIQDTEGTSLPGFPSDPHYQVQTDAGGANLVTFEPTEEIPVTTVQGAIERVQTNAEGQLASPALTGTPTAPTAAVGTDTTQLATTAFVNAQVLDEDDMATDSATRPASQQSVKAYVDTEVAAASLILAWVNFNGTGTVAIRDSFNVSSITDNGTGDYTINFATALPNANYIVVGGGANALNRAVRVKASSANGSPALKTTTQVTIKTGLDGNDGPQDAEEIYVMVIGTPA
jgi:hypothetical protein